MGDGASPDARRSAESRPALERPGLLRGVRDGPRDGARSADHLDRREECAQDVPCTADALALVHVRAQPRACPDARVSRDAVPGGARVQPARRAVRAGLRAGRLPRLLDLAARRRRHDVADPCGALAAQALRTMATFRPLPAGTATSSSRHRGRRSRVHAISSRSAAGSQAAQRAGCIAGGAKTIEDDPAAQARLCSRLARAADALACVRGVGNQAYAGEPAQQLALFHVCREMPAGAEAGCDAWFGQTFNVVTNGRFLHDGCPRLESYARTPLRSRGRTVVGSAARHLRDERPAGEEPSARLDVLIHAEEVAAREVVFAAAGERLSLPAGRGRNPGPVCRRDAARDPRRSRPRRTDPRARPAVG